MIDSVLRIVSVLVVILVVGLVWFRVSLSRLRRNGTEESDARPKAAQQAKRSALIAAFLYMVGMVSVAGLFM
jgi:ABC-type uncharacterized transport system YnjBCD permease subunit